VKSHQKEILKIIMNEVIFEGFQLPEDY